MCLFRPCLPSPFAFLIFHLFFPFACSFPLNAQSLFSACGFSLRRCNQNKEGGKKRKGKKGLSVGIIENINEWIEERLAKLISFLYSTRRSIQFQSLHIKVDSPPSPLPYPLQFISIIPEQHLLVVGSTSAVRAFRTSSCRFAPAMQNFQFI